MVFVQPANKLGILGARSARVRNPSAWRMSSASTGCGSSAASTRESCPRLFAAFPKAFGEFHQGQPLPGVGDGAERHEQPCCIGLAKNCGQCGIGSLIRAALVLEQRGDSNAKNGGDLFKPAASDAVKSVLVFLDLLKRYPDLFAERRLGHTQVLAVSPHTAADEQINRF